MPPAKTNSGTGRSTLDAPGRRRLPPLLRRAWYSLNQAFRRRIAHLQITPDQFTILRWLSESDLGGITQRELANVMASDPNTIASTLKRMESAGLIECLPDKTDRRANRIRTRPRGRTRYAAARKIAVQLQRQVLGVLPAAECQRFLAQLEAVANACRSVTQHRPREK